MKNIDVTAAIIQKDGHYLIAKRKQGRHLAGKWEFPGGRVEAGESPEQALAREIEEELSVKAIVGDFFHSNTHHYPDKSVRLLSYGVRLESEHLLLTAHDEVQWVQPPEFSNYDFAEADLPIVEKIIRTHHVDR